ncbi:MAG: hypothetical protein AAGB12_16345 [Pseudomonadota bacterium]
MNNTWKTLTKDGNDAFDLCDHFSAEMKYIAALEVAKHDFQYTSKPDDAVSQVIVSYLNLADNYIEMKMIEQATTFLLQAFRAMEHLEQRTLPDDWKHACFQGKRRIVEAFWALKKHHPDLPLCEKCYAKIFGTEGHEMAHQTLH